MMVRCFAALALPEPVRVIATQQLEALRLLDWPVRWVRPEGMHLTLKFYGEVPAERVETLAESLRFAAEGIGPLTLSLGGLGAFPSLRRARALWLGLEGPPALEILQDRVERRAEELGYAPEGSVFRPHVTLGRVREGMMLPVGAEALFGEAATDVSGMVEQVTLYQSEPGPGGARYAALHEVSLRG
ncbi:MAG TPA: RNA 2',3'-cyclic phosphodiesterase [Gemmatimonadales bacterium]|nr:RNA 2',3'-cyclic phosphodiesterase [Gemmatimonadales bacterium]